MADRARDRLIGSAIELVRRQGVAGTGVNELLEHSKTARRSIYLNFPGGKDQLIAESTAVAGEFIAVTIDDLAADRSPVEALDAFMGVWRTVLVDSDFTAGCPVAAAALAGNAAPSGPPAAAAVFADWERRLATHLRAAGVAHDEARSLATMVVATIEGAIILSVSGKSAAPLDAVLPHLTALVEAHLPTGAS